MCSTRWTANLGSVSALLSRAGKAGTGPQLCGRRDSSAFPHMHARKATALPSPISIRLSFVFATALFSAASTKALEKLQRSQAARGRGGQSTVCSPLNKLLHELQGEIKKKKAFVSGAGAAGAAAVSQTLCHPRKRLAKAPAGGGEHCRPFAPTRHWGLHFSPFSRWKKH